MSTFSLNVICRFTALLTNFGLVTSNGQRGIYLQRSYTQIQLQVFASQGK